MILSLNAPTVADIQRIGSVIADNAKPGDLVMLTGPLGAGKTTMTQGIARGLGVKGAVSSPTFVIAQIHRGERLDLVHVDAYRLNSIEELDALDLDASLEESLTVVEWGAGKVEVLSEDRLELMIERPEGSDVGLEPEDLYEDAPRVIKVHAYGPRGAEFQQVLAEEVPGATRESDAE